LRLAKLIPRHPGDPEKLPKVSIELTKKKKKKKKKKE
jgi:hypothetical protein